MALLLQQLLPFPVEGHGLPVPIDNLEDCHLDLKLNIIIDVLDFNVEIILC
jgi:hypothetical protein